MSEAERRTERKKYFGFFSHRIAPNLNFSINIDPYHNLRGTKSIVLLSNFTVFEAPLELRCPKRSLTNKARNSPVEYYGSSSDR